MKTWFKVINKAPAGYAGEIEVHNEIGFWGVTSADFIREAKAIDGKLLVRINSPGGVVNEAVAIYNYLRSRTSGVDTVVDGWAASAASIIMLAGEQRSIGTGAFVMVHRAMAGVMGNPDQMRKVADDLEKIEGGIRDIFAERTGADPDAISAWFDGEDHWLSALEALAGGFANTVHEQLKAVAHFDPIGKFKNVPAAVLQALHTPQQQKEMIMKDLLKALGLSEDASEAAAIDAVTKLKADAQAAQDLAQESEAAAAQAKALAQTAQAELATHTDQLITAEVDDAIAAGKIDATARDSMLALASVNRAEFSRVVAAIKAPAAATNGVVLPPEGTTDPANWRVTRAAQIEKQLQSN